MAVHHHEHVVTFGECDPAGVVYFPVYFDWFHQAMESWFHDGLEIAYREALATHGFPAVHTEADFVRPCRMGERLVIELRVGELTGRTFRLEYRVVGPEEKLRATGATVCAVIEPEEGGFRFRGVALPDFLREKMAKFIESS